MTDHDAGGSAARGVQVGALIAGYRLEEQIGSGGIAVVFRAYDSRLDRSVALKVLTPDLANDNSFRERFIRESRAAAAVDDPHIIPVFEAGEAAGVLFIAMRYVRGGDVRSLIDRSGRLPPDRVANVVSQVAMDQAPRTHGAWSIATSSRPTCCWRPAPPGTSPITCTCLISG